MLICSGCCCDAIGYDQSSWSWPESCLSGVRVIQNVASDISKLSEVKLLFAGNNGLCGNAIRFSGGQWTTIKAWIEAGGRMFIAAEHSGNLPSKCLQDMPNLNSFLSTIGSAITYVGDDWNDSFPLCNPTYYAPGSANIAQGINFTGERFGEVSGGTTLWIGKVGGTNDGAGKTAAVIERLGDGFVIVQGDGNSGHCSGYCDFVQRMFDYDIDDVI